jgi:hypothetical protein
MYVFINTMLMTWTPLVSASDFTGIQTDLSTVAAGLVTIALTIVGVFFVIKTLTR